MVEETPEDTRSGKWKVFIHEATQWLTDASLSPSDRSPEETAAGAHPGQARILVVDDNADMREYITRIIRQNPRWTADAAADGLGALEAVGKQKPDLILSDVMMPNLDGFGLLKALKDSPHTAYIPVIFLSARAGEEATLEGLQHGADDYLIKPFSARELLARVRTQLEITRTRQDNTQLRAAEEELKKFKVISDYAFDAFILMREDGTFAYLNKLALERWGYTWEEALSLRVPDVDPIYQEAVFKQAFAQAQKQGSLPPFETIHKRKDGTIYPVEVSMGAITLEGIPYLFAVARDITQQVAARQKIEQSEKEAQALAQELSMRNEQLRRTNVDLDTFVYTASHDLKAPILNIDGLLKALQKQIGPEVLRKDAVGMTYQLLNSQVNRFKTTIEDLTEVARIGKEISEDVEAIDLTVVLREVLEDLEPQRQQAQAAVETRMDCPPVVFSRKNLKSILYNLLSNAIKYRSPERGLRIGVSCHPQGDYYLLRVEDNGLGMDMRQEQKIFALFKRLHNHVEGTGIGLYIVKRMIENAGGRIEVESQVGAGSAFKVYFKR